MLFLNQYLWNVFKASEKFPGGLCRSFVGEQRQRLMVEVKLGGSNDSGTLHSVQAVVYVQRLTTGQWWADVTTEPSTKRSSSVAKTSLKSILKSHSIPTFCYFLALKVVIKDYCWTKITQVIFNKKRCWTFYCFAAWKVSLKCWI